ncbi:LiaF domain-containing protein [Corynebacterium sp. zg331]|uniref:LiaF domain-containing protein n=1 Tax=unclassified Corynebacterium TaxID=2624378 RepID=UPI00351B082A
MAALTHDLPAPATAPPPAFPTAEKEKTWVLLSSSRTSLVALPERHTVVTVLGNLKLDLRNTHFSSRNTTIHAQAHLGHITIIVPPEVRVQMDGTSILGLFSHKRKIPEGPSSNGPVLRITGLALLGGVKVVTKPV